MPMSPVGLVCPESQTAAKARIKNQVRQARPDTPRGSDLPRCEPIMRSGDELAPYRRPLLLGSVDHALGVAGKLASRLRRVEEIEPLAADQPKLRISGDRHPTRDPDRIVAAEAWHIDLGVGREVGLVTGDPKTPGRAGNYLFERAFSRQCRPVGEISDGVEAADRQPAHRVGDD